MSRMAKRNADWQGLNSEQALYVESCICTVQHRAEWFAPSARKQSTPTSACFTMLRAAMNALDEAPDCTGVRLFELAKSVGLQPSYLSELFRGEYGTRNDLWDQAQNMMAYMFLGPNQDRKSTIPELAMIWDRVKHFMFRPGRIAEVPSFFEVMRASYSAPVSNREMAFELQRIARLAKQSKLARATQVVIAGTEFRRLGSSEIRDGLSRIVDSKINVSVLVPRGWLESRKGNFEMVQYEEVVASASTTGKLIPTENRGAGFLVPGVTFVWIELSDGESILWMVRKGAQDWHAGQERFPLCIEMGPVVGNHFGEWWRSITQDEVAPPEVMANTVDTPRSRRKGTK
jgi:hypothetical protein